MPSHACDPPAHRLVTPLPDAGGGLRERKKRQTRRALQDAALRLVTAHGLANVTVADIAGAANVSTRTFFNHFDCKEAALVAPDPDSPAALAAALDARPAAEPPLPALYAAVRQVSPDHAEQLHRGHLLLAACPEALPHYLASFAVFEQVIIDWFVRRAGADPHASPRPAMLAALATTGVRLAAAYWQPERGRDHFIDLIDEFFGLLVPADHPPLTRPTARSGA